jgi:hypothetical protein
MNNTLSEELQQIFAEMEAAGLNPRLCDTPVPYIDTSVVAGLPTMPGEPTKGQYLMLPRDLVGMHPTFIVPVRGDSMCDAEISAGDLLHVQVVDVVHDGDIIVVSIDDEYTVKAYCEDEHGDKWLVPRNEAYNPIRLTEDMDIRVIGKVVECVKQAPRCSYADMMKSIKRVRGKEAESERPLTPDRLRTIILELGSVVKHGRQWYAVYRAMVDRGVLPDGDYSDFVDKVCELLPNHGHLPVASELRRMAVQSFRKPTALWERTDAPVSGQRFDDYLAIARTTHEKLSKRR